MMQIRFLDDLNRPLDEEGNIVMPSPQSVLIRRVTPSDNGYYESVNWYSSLYCNFTENDASPSASLNVYAYLDAVNASGVFDGYVRLKVEISTNNFSSILSTTYFLGRHVGSGSGVDAYFQPGGALGCYARSNTRKSIQINMRYFTYAGGNIALPFTGVAYQVRTSMETSTNAGNSWYTVGTPKVYRSHAPFYLPITKPAKFYMNKPNQFGASIGAAYKSTFSTTIYDSGNTRYIGNEPVRTVQAPYISVGQQTEYIYWFPQHSIQWKRNGVDHEYTMTCSLSIEDLDDPGYFITVAKTTVTGDAEYLEEDDLGAFSVAVEFEDPSGLYDRYGVLLRNTDASLVSRATLTLRYGAKGTVTVKPFGANSYTDIYTGQESKVVEYEQEIPASGSSASTSVIVNGICKLTENTFSAQIIDYYVPSFPNLAIHRCKADGSKDDNGDHCRIEWSVAITSINNQNSKSLSIRHPAGTAEYSPLDYYSQSGNMIVAADTESGYEIIFTLSDDLYNGNRAITKTLRLSSAGVIMDWLYGGKGISFGKVAEKNDAVEITDDWELICKKLLLSGTDVVAWMKEVLSRMKAIEQFASNIGSTGQYEVSFYNGDTLHDRQWVLAGNNAEAPEELPEAASTKQYAYAFAGWTRTEGGSSADPDALENVTDTRILYAAYVATLRAYNIKFINGTDVLQQNDNISYGGSVSFSGTTPAEDGKSFICFNPTPSFVESAMDCYAQFYDNSEIEDDWDAIIEECEAGTAAAKYKLGQYKALDLGSEGVITFKLVGIKRDTIGNGRKAQLSFLATKALKTSRPMNNVAIEKEMYYVDTPSWNQLWVEGQFNSSNREDGTVSHLKVEHTATASGTATVSYRVYNASGSVRIDIDGNTVVADYSLSDWATYEFSVISGETHIVEAYYTSAGNSNAYARIDIDESVSGVFPWAGTTLQIYDYQKPYIKRWKSGTGTVGGWAEMDLRAWLKANVLPLFPANVANAIKTVKKVSDACISEVITNERSAVSAKVYLGQCVTQDDIWIPSAKELFGADRGDQSDLAEYGSNTDERKKTKVNASSYVMYSLRDSYVPSGSGYTQSRSVGTGGAKSYGDASTSRAIVIGFCL